MEKLLKGYPITFNLYATGEEEVAECRAAIVGFIKSHAEGGRAVTAKKVTEAVLNWDKNPLVRNRIINHFKQ